MVGLPLATLAGNAQTPWLEAIERRLALTAKALASIKAMKMTGLDAIMSTKIASLRSAEIRASQRYRILNVLVSMACKQCTYYGTAPLF